MEYYRLDGRLKKACNSVGCVIGHCIVLDDRPIEKLPRTLYTLELGFHEWAIEFTGLNYYMNSWRWMFYSDWHKTDNSPVGAALRIDWWLEHGLPDNWDRQMLGIDPLCYRENNSNILQQ